MRCDSPRETAASRKVRPAKKRRLTSRAASGSSTASRVSASSQRDQLFVLGVQGDFDVVEIDAVAFTASFGTLLVACAIEENPPHRLGSGGKEVASTVPFPGFVHIHKPDVGLMNQGRRLECLARLFLGQLGRRQLPQLVVDQRQKFLCRRWITGFDLQQDTGDVGSDADPQREREGEPASSEGSTVW